MSGRERKPGRAQPSILKRRDIAAAILLLWVGIFVTRHGYTLTYRDEFGPGPGFLPIWLGRLLAALAAIQIFVAWRQRKEALERSHTMRALSTWFAFAASVFAMQWLGFIGSLALITFFLVFVIERRSLTATLTVTAAVAISFAVLFRLLLPVPLP